MKKALLTLLIAIALMANAKAQELNCQVRVNSSQVEGSDKTVFQSLQTSLVEFLNNNKFTEINFRQNEKIDCSILLNIKSRENEYLSGEINIALTRPVYKTNYNTPLFNYIDKRFTFEYMDGQTLDFNPNTYISNLTSVVGYYVYLMLGLDFDTFSVYGGDPFFAIAQTIAQAAPQPSDPKADNGWSTTGRQNRYALISEINNQTYRPLRQFLYDYHRLGLDLMSEHPEEGREALLSALTNLQNVYERNSMCYFLQLIVESKRDEIIQAFSQGNMKLRTEAANIMKSIDPSQSSRYDEMLQGK